MDTSRRDFLLSAASDALAGRIGDINVRRAGSIALLNAGRELMWTGFSPEAEVLKGLIVRVDPGTGAATDLVAGCLPKFYNMGENEANDAGFFAALAAPGARLLFTGKEDGTCMRAYVHPDTGEVGFATRGMPDSRGVVLDYIDFTAVSLALAAERFPALLDAALVSRYTVVCELIHPDNRILTNYGDRLDLPVITVIDLATGAEIGYEATAAFCAEHGLSIVPQVRTSSGDFLAAVAEIKASLLGTDAEGVVASVEAPGRAVPYRLKVKGATYLRLLALARGCTFVKTVGLVTANGFDDWESLRAYLHGENPDLPEEIVASYKTHYDRYEGWLASCDAEADAFVAEYAALPRDVPQKEFALSIASVTPVQRKSALFALRNEDVRGGDMAAARAHVVESVRFRRRDELKEHGIDDAISI